MDDTESEARDILSTAAGGIEIFDADGWHPLASPRADPAADDRGERASPLDRDADREH